MRRGNIKTMVARAITVVQMLPELDSGGVERGTLELGRYLCRHGHQSIVISAGGRLVSQLEREGSRHIYWKVGSKHPACLRYFFPLRRLLQIQKVDILHLRSRLPAWLGYLAWKSLPERKRPRLVTTFHGFYSINRYSAVMTKGERVVAISRCIADHILTQYKIPEEKIVLIHRGVDDAYFDPATVSDERILSLKQRWGLAEYSGPLLMLPGRISPWKGHDIFIKSLALIKNLPWLALCVGDQDDGSLHRQGLRRLVNDLNLTGRVKFTGHCTDMPAALMIADVVISASSTEPEAFGRVAIEAQAMGRPVIASAHGGSLETVLDRKTGWLVQPRDEVALAGALTKAILNKELRNTFGGEGQRWVRKNFTIEKMCRTTLELYQYLLERRAPDYSD